MGSHVQPDLPAAAASPAAASSTAAPEATAAVPAAQPAAAAAAGQETAAALQLLLQRASQSQHLLQLQQQCKTGHPSLKSLWGSQCLLLHAQHFVSDMTWGLLNWQHAGVSRVSFVLER
jgi:hypothetical protein